MSGAVDPGALRHRIQLLMRQSAVDPETGSASETFIPGAAVWASLSAISTVRGADGAGVRIQRRRAATLRVGPILRPDDRILAEDIAWQITGQRADTDYLTLELEEITP